MASDVCAKSNHYHRYDRDIRRDREISGQDRNMEKKKHAVDSNSGTNTTDIE